MSSARPPPSPEVAGRRRWHVAPTRFSPATRLTGRGGRIHRSAASSREPCRRSADFATSPPRCSGVEKKASRIRPSPPASVRSTELPSPAGRSLHHPPPIPRGHGVVSSSCAAGSRGLTTTRSVMAWFTRARAQMLHRKVLGCSPGILPESFRISTNKAYEEEVRERHKQRKRRRSQGVLRRPFQACHCHPCARPTRRPPTAYPVLSVLSAPPCILHSPRWLPLGRAGAHRRMKRRVHRPTGCGRCRSTATTMRRSIKY